MQIRKTLICLCLSFAPVLISATAHAIPSTLLKVGVIAPLSGPVAPMGEAFRKGFELYNKDKPGCENKVALIFEDGKYDGKATTSALQKLTAIDGVQFTIVWGNTPASVCAPIAESKKSPLLAVAYTPEGRGRSYVVTFGPRTKLLSGKIAEEFRGWNLKKPAAVTVNIGNALEGIEYVKEALKNNLTVEVVALEETDFKSILAKLRGRGVDGLILFLLPEQAMSFARQSVELHYTPPIIGGDVFADLEFGKRIAPLLPRLGFVYSSVDPAFIKRVGIEFNTASYFYEVASGYSLADMACELGSRSTDISPLAMMELIKSAKLEHSPISGLRFVSDSDYGSHFENDAQIHYLSGGPSVE